MPGRSASGACAPHTTPTRIDPRLYQIAVLTGLLAYGLLRLRFEVRWPHVVITLAAALLTQAWCSRRAALPFDPRSALISGLSLCLLLRTGSPLVSTAAAVIAIASKFALRWRGKHVWNPTNLAVVVMLATGTAWVSPGQWGSAIWFAFLIACLGTLVVSRAARADVTLAFLVAHALVTVAVARAYGQPIGVPLHRLQNGALLLFAFFMISDPRTTPDSRAGRIVFAALVALGGAFVQYALFRTNGPLWALAACAPLVPLIDRLRPGERFHWPLPLPRPDTLPRGELDETHPALRPVPAARAAVAPGRP